MYRVTPKKRYSRTIDFLQSVLPAPATLLDLGVRNELSEIMESYGYQVINTEGEDLDQNLERVKTAEVDAVTAFEIFEHLVSPYNVISAIPCKKLIATVPLNLWFARAYRSDTDPWDRHYHEFEDWQFDWKRRVGTFERPKSGRARFPQWEYGHCLENSHRAITPYTLRNKL